MYSENNDCTAWSSEVFSNAKLTSMQWPHHRKGLSIPYSFLRLSSSEYVIIGISNDLTSNHMELIRSINN